MEYLGLIASSYGVMVTMIVIGIVCWLVWERG